MTTWRMALSVLVLAALAAAAPAQEFINVGIGGGGGLYTPTVSPHNPQLFMISCDMGGTYISRDAGRTWETLDYRQLSNSRLARPLFDPFEKKVIYAAAGNVLKKSDDAGRVWQVFVAPNTAPWKEEAITHVAMSTISRRTIYVGTSGGFYYSTDAGVKWKKAETLSGECGGVLALATHVFAAFGNTVYHSQSSGENWEALDTPGDGLVTGLAGGVGKTGKAVVYAAVAGEGLVGSEDLGKAWHTLVTDAGIHDVVMPPDQNAIAYCASRSDIWRTSDAGGTWDKCFFMKQSGRNQPNVTMSWVQTELKWGYSISPKGLGVSQSAPNTVMVATQGDLYISTDGGRRWNQAVNQPAGSPPGERSAAYTSIGLEVTSAWQYLIDPNENARHYVAFTDIGFIRSLDRGRTWICSTTGSPWRNTFYEVVFDPFAKGRLLAAASDQHDIPHWTQIDHVKDSGGVVVSEDFGKTWKAAGSGLPQKPCTAIALDPASKKGALTMYAALYGDGVYKTSDGGATWQRKSDNLGRQGNNHVFMVKVQKDTGYVYCGVTGSREDSKFPVPGGLWRSEDAGTYWNDVTADLNLHWPGGFDFDPRDPKVIYLAACTIPGSNEGGLYKTADGGATWKRLLKDEDFASAGGPGYVQALFVSVSPHDPDRVYLSTVGHGLWVSADAGETWKQMPGLPFASISRVCFPPVDSATIYVTTFGGAVWKGPAVPGGVQAQTGPEPRD